jgi:uncharacterized protein YdaU (DUF1376 family)
MDLDAAASLSLFPGGLRVSREAFLPLFFGDFLASTAEWEGEEASLYLTLLGHQWALGSLPVEPSKLCRLVRWDKKNFERCWPQVAGKFDEQGGRLYNPRLEQHRGKARLISETAAASGRNGAAAKWGNTPGPDHRKTRAQRLAEARRRGVHTALEWQALLRICGDVCRRCDGLGPFVKDHIIPIYQGGSDAIENIQPLCKRCNSSKGADCTDHRPDDWQERLAKCLTQPEKTPSEMPDGPQALNGWHERLAPYHKSKNEAEESEACQGEERRDPQ